MTDPVPSGREVLERLSTPTGDWQLQQREGHYEIICNGVFLMASYNLQSSRSLAAAALERVKGAQLRVLVGGLGIGYTAGAVLEDPRVRSLDLVEVEPVVVRWHREYFAPLTGRPLDDARTNLIVADLAQLTLPPGALDLMLLDTDNFPQRVIREQNAVFYEAHGIAAFLQALRPGGVIAFWASDRSRELMRALDSVAVGVEEIEVPEMIAPDRGDRAWIYVGVRAEGSGGQPPI